MVNFITGEPIEAPEKKNEEENKGIQKEDYDDEEDYEKKYEEEIRDFGVATPPPFLVIVSQSSLIET